MCNLYAVTRSADEMRRVFRADRDETGNLPSLPGIFPDGMAPVVRLGKDGARELLRMRWGFPCPPNLGTRPVTNVRNVASPFWRGWLKPKFRCLVPATSFCEWSDSTPKVPHWFALNDERPLFAFAGIWRPWTGERKGEAGRHLLFSFLTTNPNDVVRSVHAKAMPVILQSNEWEAWLTGPTEDAVALQRPLPSELLKVVATGARKDEAAAHELV